MSQTGTIDQTDEQTDIKTKKPKMYVVMVHNDPITPRFFVVEVLQRYFGKNADEATKIMLRAHKNGLGMVDIYTHEIAEMKASVANTYSREQNRPLLFTVEEE